jgi:hypothetical protein
MDLYQRQQFDFFLQTATERFVERLHQRFRGAQPALEALQSDPESKGVYLHEFMDAVFDDFLLANADGASFILRCLAKKQAQPHAANPSDSGTVEEVLVCWAKSLFTALLVQKSIEVLQQQVSYQPIPFGED